MSGLDELDELMNQLSAAGGRISQTPAQSEAPSSRATVSQNLDELDSLMASLSTASSAPRKLSLLFRLYIVFDNAF
jgi:hypothetical protein